MAEAARLAAENANGDVDITDADAVEEEEEGPELAKLDPKEWKVRSSSPFSQRNHLHSAVARPLRRPRSLQAPLPSDTWSDQLRSPSKGPQASPG